MAFGSSQARGRIRAVAAGLCHSHSNAESELCLNVPHSFNPLSEARDRIHFLMDTSWVD